MIKIKKILAIVVLIVLLLAIATPYLAGLITYARYMQALEVLQQINGVKLENIQYKRKYLTAIATTHVDISRTSLVKKFANIKPLATASENQDIHFTIEHKFFHGPIVPEKMAGSGEKKWHFIQALAFSAARMDDPIHTHVEVIDKEIARARTVIHLSGSGQTLIESLAFNHNNVKKNVKVSWDAFKALFEFAPNFAQLKGKAEISKVDIQSQAHHVHLNNVLLDIDRKIGKAHLWYGKQQLKIGMMREKTQQQHNEVKEFHIDVEQLLKDKLVQYNLNANLDAAKFLKGDYKNGTLTLNVAKLSPKALHRWHELFHDIDKGSISNKDFKLLDKALELVPQLLKTKPTLHLNYGYDAVSGPVKTEINLSIQDKKVKKLTNLFHVLNYLQGDAYLYLPESVLKSLIEDHVRKRIVLETREKPLSEADYILRVRKSTTEMLEALVKDKIFVKQNDHYSLKAKLIGDELLLNGKTHKLPF